MQQKHLEKKLVLKKNIKIFISKTLISIIIFLIGMILIKSSNQTRSIIKQNIFEQSIKFTKYKKLYDKYLGNILSIDKMVYEEKPVFNEKIAYKEIHEYKDGVALTVEENYMVPCIKNGIVVYIGTKEEYGQTIVIEQENGIDVFYSNIETAGIKLYDYIQEGDYVGQVKTNQLYLIFKQNGKVLNYKDHL